MSEIAVGDRHNAMSFNVLQKGQIHLVDFVLPSSHRGLKFIKTSTCYILCFDIKFLEYYLENPCSVSLQTIEIFQ